ncbi:MAG TPA: MbcA/ParS/Xre antitoxin family protein [Polyangiales bacterium]
MGPQAAKVIKELRKAKRSGVIDLRAAREASELQQGLASAQDDLGPLPPNHAHWMRVFKVLASLGHALLGTSALRKLSERVEAADQEYMPGGPPSSPILDSVFISWWMADVGVGPRRESMCSILADLALVMDLPAVLAQGAKALAQSHMGVYRVTELGPDRVQLDELLTGRSVCSRLPRDLRGRAKFWLTRLLPSLLPGDPDWVVWTTPYELDGPDVEHQWLAYCERAVAGVASERRAERLAQHFKAADDPRRWTEYIMNGYAGVTPVGSIVLTGIPDRPGTLPHHPDYDAAEAGDPHGTASPFERVRLRLHALAQECGFAELDPKAAQGAPAVAPKQPQRFAEVERILTLAYRTYGQLDSQGRSALELLAQDASELPAEERRMLDALLAGWFSAFEVLRVKVDEGMELRDVLRGRTLWITERSATRQVQLGDLLVGWIVVEPDRNTLEGAVCHVPAMLAPRYVADLRTCKDAAAREHPALGWKKQHGLLARQAVPLLETVFADAPMPVLRNGDGDDVLVSEAHYEVVDEARVSKVLAERFDAEGDGVSCCLGGEVLLARLVLRGRKLSVECNSRKRLENTKALLQDALGAALLHRADTHTDPQVLLKDARNQDHTASPMPQLEFPPEAKLQIQALLLERMRRWLDEPIPMLGGKTPRQAVRTERGRDDVTLMLTHQQQLFAAGPGVPPIDLREIWQALGLEPRA